jgi:pimeloyl-ACP methyl ester carboxylesterase
VVTYAPRGFGRSQRTDSAKGSTPDEHADDLHRLITALGAGPVDIFGSSGGAVNDDPMVGQHIVNTTPLRAGVRRTPRRVDPHRHRRRIRVRGAR